MLACWTYIIGVDIDYDLKMDTEAIPKARNSIKKYIFEI